MNRAILMSMLCVVLACSSPPDTSTWEIPEVDSRRLQGAVKDALTTAAGELRVDPSLAEAWGRYAMVLDAHSQYGPAEVCYERARQLAPDDFRWAYHFGYVKDARGGPASEMVAAFEDAIRLRPGYVAARFRYGEALMRQGLMEEAKEAFEGVVEQAPDLAVGYRSLGQVLIAMNRPEEAIPHLELAGELHPENGKIFVALARAYAMTGDTEAAERAQARSGGSEQRTFPDPARLEVLNLTVNPSTLVTRGLDKMHRGEFAAAIADFESFLESAPDHAEAEMLLGLCYGRTGDSDSAIRHLSRAAWLRDDLVEAHFELAGHLLVQGERDRAIEHLNHVLELQPDHARARRALDLRPVAGRRSWLTVNVGDAAPDFTLPGIEDG